MRKIKLRNLTVDRPLAVSSWGEKNYSDPSVYTAEYSCFRLFAGDKVIRSGNLRSRLNPHYTNGSKNGAHDLTATNLPLQLLASDVVIVHRHRSINNIICYSVLCFGRIFNCQLERWINIEHDWSKRLRLDPGNEKLFWQKSDPYTSLNTFSL